MSDLNIVDSSIKLFSIDKPTIVFELNNNNNNLTNININASISSQNPILRGQTSIMVSNLTSEYLSLRTKTTKKSYYNLFPSYCIIPPNSEQKLDFKYFVKEGEQVSNSGHKFKFEGFIISPEEKDQDPRLLFNKYISEKIPVKASLIKASVAFIEKEEINKDNEENNKKNGINEISNNEINNININNDSKNNIISDLNINQNENTENNIINNFNNTNEKNNETNNNINNEINIDNITNGSNHNIINDIKKSIKENNDNNINDTTNNIENNINIDNINNKVEENVVNDKKTKDNIIEKDNSIDTKEKEIILEEKNSNKDLLFKPSTKTLSLNINNSFLNNKNESKEKKIFLTHNKNKYDLHSNKEFGTPKRKRFNTNLKNEEFENEKTEEEKTAILNGLKVEYYKLKNELDNLIERYYNLRNHVDLEEDNRDLATEENLKNKYSERKKNEIKLPQHICLGLFIFAVFLGFYLS